MSIEALAKRRQTIFLLLLACVVLSLLLIVIGIAMQARRVATSPAEGRGTDGRNPIASTIVPGQLRVAQFNIRRGVGTDGLLDLRRVADEIKGFDVVGLNEIDGDSPGFSHQAHALGRLAGYNWLYAPSEKRFDRYNTGNAILTNLLIDYWTRVPMERTKPDGHRNYVHAKMEADGKPFSLILTHTDGAEDRDAQIDLVLKLFESIDEPVIVMGDFNTRADHPLLRELMSRADVIEPLTALGKSVHPKRIDWIFARGFDAIDADVIDHGVSDHPMYTATLRFKDR